jgi:hypothetical protein
MKKIVILLLVSTISSFAFSQQMLTPVAHKLENTRYIGTPLSLDGYLKKNKEICTNRIAEQMLKLNKEQNKDFLNYTKAIGSKLKKIDDRCKYFRFEIIDYIEDGGMDMRFAYRCYATANGTLPHQRVSHIDPLVINPAVFYDDQDMMKEDCNALAIIKKLNTKTAKSMQNSGASSSSTTPAKSSSSSSSKSKKGSGQN